MRLDLGDDNVRAPVGTAATGWRRLVVEPRRPEVVRRLSWAHWLVLGTVCIGAFMGQLDASIITMAFPELRRDFGTSLASVQWVGQAYLLVLIGLLMAVGRYADMVGRKLLYTYGFALFVVASALCGLAPSLGLLIAFRALQGVGAAMYQANSVAILVSAVPRNHLGRAVGVQGTAQALGLALGPAVGGALIGLGGWRLIFYVNVPVGALGALLAWLLVPRSTNLAGRESFDWAGLGLFGPAVCSLLLALSEGLRAGWGSLATLSLFGAAALLGALFLARERRASVPLLCLDLFRRLPFSAGIASGLLSYVVLFGALTVVPFYLELAKGQPSGRAGIELLVLPLGLAVAAPAAGRLADRVGARPLTVAGMALAAAMLMATTLLGANLGFFLLGLAGIGVGLGAFTPANNAAIMGSAPPALSGLASGVLNMTRGLGTSLGLAIAGLAYTAGSSSKGAGAHAAGAGYRDAAVVLVASAVVAAAVGALRGAGPLNDVDGTGLH
ncbi:MAG TPA: MFS transporter [Acidimicrobiales bacterium]|nr:MFS transporter [Acidimicrobiales bacterium]